MTRERLSQNQYSDGKIERFGFSHVISEAILAIAILRQSVLLVLLFLVYNLQLTNCTPNDKLFHFECSC